MTTKDEITNHYVYISLCTVFEGNSNIHLVVNSFGTLFYDKIFSLTCSKFPDISRFSRQVVTLLPAAVQCSRNVFVPCPKQDSGSGLCKPQITHVPGITSPPVLLGLSRPLFTLSRRCSVLSMLSQQGLCSESINMLPMSYFMCKLPTCSEITHNIVIFITFCTNHQNKQAPFSAGFRPPQAIFPWCQKRS